MIYLGRHRVIKEIDKQIAQGQALHFLTGDGVNDNFFYDLHDGIKNLADTLKNYYDYDYFLQVTSATGDPTCFQKERGEIKNISFDDVIIPSNRSGALKPRKRESESAKQGENAARNEVNAGKPVVEKIEEVIQKGEKKFFILIENFEWMSKLYESDPDTTWISKLKSWENFRNLRIVVTLKDMELLKKYSFNQKEIFIGFPSAEEIRYAYLRWLMRNTAENYNLNMSALDEIAHGMSVGEKTLFACMRILRKVVEKNLCELTFQDFNESIEHGIEEKIPWEKVRLEQGTKDKIMTAIDAFLQAGEDKKARSGMIFTGPPGTGKTLIAKSLASEKQCYFLAPTLAELKGEYIGQSSAKIKRIFDKARANQPTIIFIDEADTVFPSRAFGASDSDSFAMDMVNQFLQEIDGAKTGLQKIFVIAATNRPESIDDAIKSRLNKPELIPLPTKEIRKSIFEDNLSEGDVKFDLTGKIFEEFLLNKSDKMSGRDIVNFVKTLKETATREGLIIGNNAETFGMIRAAFEDSEKKFLNELISRGIFTEANIISPQKNTKKLRDIIGYEAQKEKICRQAEYIEATEARKNEYKRMKVEPPKGVLLYGPPGNGKSELAQAVAGERGFYFFKVLSKDFASGFPSEQIRRLENIFTEIERFSKLTEQKGILLFFDEFDSLAGKNNLNQVVRGSLLNYIADEKTLRSRDSKILFMAATNFYDDIDDAMKRKGRIDAHIFMDNPTEQDAQDILSAFIAEENVVTVDSANFISNAYDRLLRELRENYLLNKYQTNNLNFLTQENLNAQRPSGADLKTFYRELKELAFLNNVMRDGKLLFNEEILNRRFRR